MKATNTPSRLNLVLFPIVYAIIVSLVTMLVSQSNLLIFHKLENAVYDQLQKSSTVDSLKGGLLYDRFKNDFNSWAGIDIDGDFFAEYNANVNRDSLALLLEVLADNTSRSIIFLDFLFLAPNIQGKNAIDSSSYRADERLKRAIQRLEDRLVMPYQIQQTNSEVIPLCGEWNASNYERVDNLYYQPKHSGFLGVRMIEGNTVHRFQHRAFNDDSQQSAIQVLANLYAAQQAEQIEKVHCTACIEINYVLRNESQSFPALEIYSASKILKADKATSTISELPRKDILFLGIFSKYGSGKFSFTDTFATPVSEDLNGIYVVINTFLNLINQSYITPAPKLLVVFLNFILGVVAVLYFFVLQRYPIKPAWLYLVESSLAFFAFVICIGVFFLFFYTKMPVVIPTLFFMRNQQWFRYFMKLRIS